ncbi:MULTISPECIES: sulfite exporter TauE/SafE family protein [Thermus]|uniref:Probable membrane transporter protein n=1 Tax=Thermus scotoductus (strain ATCC 700910 / SA-01) TaxID=743525 RepID=E8PLJ4_THESS|nr:MULTISPECIES: sulfite exporter TauE/SafE family protein [Thermus]ADW22343.1 transport protein [Thermus scotoductus SA-01]
MSFLAFTFFLFLASVLAGFVGALTGLGGGVVLVPMLTLLFGVDLKLALGASLVSVIATSSGAAAAYVREGFTNLRLGMLLEVATTLGAVAGASLTARLPHGVVAGIFGLVLLHSAYMGLRGWERGARADPGPPDPLAVRLRLQGTYPGPRGSVPYAVRRVVPGFLLMGLAGVLSGLLGIGSGAVKVLAMDRIMGLPYKVSTTSTFMIGVTAAAGAGVYLRHGFIHPDLAFPVVLGVLLGAVLRARLLPGAKVSRLRLLFSGVIALLGLEMLAQGLWG